jgi:DNA-binding beta-propeller fold protein YncE
MDPCFQLIDSGNDNIKEEFEEANVKEGLDDISEGLYSPLPRCDASASGADPAFLELWAKMYFSHLFGFSLWQAAAFILLCMLLAKHLGELHSISAHYFKSGATGATSATMAMPMVSLLPGARGTHRFFISNVALLLLLGIPIAQTAQSTPMTSTLVGTLLGEDDGTGTNAKFNSPFDVALSPAGTFALVSDKLNNAIRRIDVDSATVTTLTPTFNRRYLQGFQSPTGMCMGDHGRVAYVFDTTNFLRRIDLYGTINAYDPLFVDNIVGHGVGIGTSRDGAYLRQDGDYYHAPHLGDTNSKLLPQDCVTTASGSFLYFIEGAGICHRVRQINLDTRVVESIAGTVVPSHPVNQKGYQDGIGSNAVFHFPTAIALSDDGQTLFVAEDRCTQYCGAAFTPYGFNHPTWGNKIRTMDLATRQVKTLAGSTQGFADGTGTNALFDGPRGIAQANGMLYVADSFNKRSALPALEQLISVVSLLASASPG